MKYLTKDNITLALLIFISVRWFFSFPSEESEVEILLREKIKDQTETIMIMQKSRNQDKIKIKNFLDEKIKSDTIIGGYTDNQLDSFMSDFLRQ